LAILTQTYNALLADLDEQHQPLLRTAQRAWLAYRDAECALQGSHVLGGSMYSQMVLVCKAEMTGARSQELVALRRTLSERLR
jgi:uncharacterized protein YecT (DUF1311 family)